MMKYDVLVEPWIPVLMLSGERKKLGLLDVLRQAHLILKIDGLNVMEEFSVYRFLILFVLSVYRPVYSDDISDIYDDECFDMDKVADYVSLCRREGVTFDIFDDQRPFLQSPYDSKLDEGNIKPISVLDKTMPSGNNPIHFVPVLQEDSVMTCDKAIRCLLSIYIFGLFGTGGYPFNINRIPPVYFLPKGKNLFSTLVLSLYPLGSLADDSDPLKLEIWRNPMVVCKDEKVVSVSPLYGMIFPCRRVTLIKEENSSVLRNCYFQPGLNFVNKNSGWRDSYVVYFHNHKNDVISLTPSIDKEMWRNIGTVYGMFYDSAINKKILSVVGQFKKILSDFDETKLTLMTFGVVVAHGKVIYYDLQRGELSLDSRIADVVEKVQLVLNALAKLESVGGCLDKHIKELSKSLFGRDICCSGVREQVLHNFYGVCESDFYVFCDKLAVVENSDADRQNCLDFWLEKIRNNVLDSYDMYCDIVCSTSKYLMKGVNQKIYFLAGVNKIIKIERSKPENA